MLPDLTRLAERLRTAPLRRVEAVAEDVRGLLQELADLAAGTAARHRAEPPEWRTVPRLGDAALGDQVSVLARELNRAIDGAAPNDRATPDEQVWTRAGRAPLQRSIESLTARIGELRRAL